MSNCKVKFYSKLFLLMFLSYCRIRLLKRCKTSSRFNNDRHYKDIK